MYSLYDVKDYFLELKPKNKDERWKFDRFINAIDEAIKFYENYDDSLYSDIDDDYYDVGI